MKRTMKISKLFAVFAVMVLALADNVYAQNGQDKLGLIEKTSEKTISPETPCTIETAIVTANKSFYADKIGLKNSESKQL